MAEQKSALENEIEEIRDRLAGTIDQLIVRSSPKTIARRQVDAVKAAYVDPVTGKPKVDTILKTAAVVGGVVVAFVLLRKFARRG